MRKLISPEKMKEEARRLRDALPSIPVRNYFGDNNHDAVKAQIHVLEDNLSEDEIYDMGWNEHQESHAVDARLWADGDGDESPFSGWEHLVRKQSGSSRGSKHATNGSK